MKIFEQAKIGDLLLNNRMVMAPMTRSRADDKGIIGDLTVKYYEQRASAGLIISETINISPDAIGMPNTPGLFNTDQVFAWKKVTDAIHGAGGKIFAQLNHSGRAAHSINRKGKVISGPSAIPIKGQQAFTSEGLKDFETPEVLTEQDIQMIIRDYKIAAQYAKDAGFDGVELHAAMGFLPNQFLMESSNQRDDQYGGSFENRSRFIVETMQALIEIFGKQRVGIRLSPSILLHDMHDRNPVGLYTHLIGSLDKLPIAYFHLIQPLFPLDKDSVYPHDVLLEFGDLITSDIIVNGGYTKEKAEMEIETGRSQFVSFGSLFLANPDLVRRFKENSIINSPDKETMYSGGDEKGYTDYPFLYEDSTH